jgi:pyruvate dehydrogenase E2 component (dihydrolipoyllysine-residue acetyltransferase)
LLSVARYAPFREFCSRFENRKGSHAERSEAWAGEKAHASHKPLTVATKPGISALGQLGLPMAQIIMPKLSDTMTEGVVVRWLKKEGDVVNMGDVLAEIETDKATMEMEAFDEGILKAVYVQEGQKVNVGEPIALISGEEESTSPGEVEKVQALPRRRIAQEKARTPQPKLAEVEHARATADVEEGLSQTPQQKPGRERSGAPLRVTEGVAGGRVKASPLARKVAARLNLDLSRIEGSGPGGRIIQEDVMAAVSSQKTPTTSSVVVPLPGLPSPEAEVIPLSPMRRIIAQRMVESKSQIPHFYVQAELDVAPLLQLRSQANESLASAGVKLSINDFVLRACVETLVRVPQLNASFTGNGILKHSHIHLGFAVSLEEGLLTPVIRSAETKSLKAISGEAKQLTERARSKKLKPDDYQGGTFTVSNLGAFGVDSFQAIINPPQAGILAVGSVVKKPVVNSNDQIVIGQRMSVTLSCDHRTVDGAIAAQFLVEFRKLIENPALMLL